MNKGRKINNVPRTCLGNEVNLDQCVCDCKYKKRCSIPRQKLHISFVKDGFSKSNEDCSFYMIFVKDEEDSK